MVGDGGAVVWWAGKWIIECGQRRDTRTRAIPSGVPMSVLLDGIIGKNLLEKLALTMGLASLRGSSKHPFLASGEAPRGQ